MSSQHTKRDPAADLAAGARPRRVQRFLLSGKKGGVRVGEGEGAETGAEKQQAAAATGMAAVEAAGGSTSSWRLVA